ncbi:MAG: sensor histidine kinase [Thainema sp.]
MHKLSGDSILVVDDIPTNIKVLFDLLYDSGFKIYVAKSGESALSKLQQVRPDLILLDVMMPGIDGFETCRRLKAEPTTKEIPVIFMTALSDVVDKVKGLQLGAVDYITKPIQHEEVLARINVHLELRQAQLKLIQEEKMSSLGQLVAGIAHEINNPVNFICGNLAHAHQYIQELFGLFQLYESHLAEPNIEIQAYSETIDLEFIKQDLPQLLSSMKVGTTRIQEIIRALHSFSRLDQAEYKSVNLHDGIDSTLMLLNNRLKVKPSRPAIAIAKEYGDLPEVECYPGPLNQVFMHLLMNAIDAIDEKIDRKDISQAYFEPQIRIRTNWVAEHQEVVVHIVDNGVGMFPQVQQQIFNQFFTTKPIGQGTGLGLSISYQIVVERHQGQLWCSSEFGQGTEFMVKIPLGSKYQTHES